MDWFLYGKNLRHERVNALLLACIHYRCATSGGEGGGLPCPFLKIEKKCPDFAKKCADFGKLCFACVHLWVEILI